MIPLKRNAYSYSLVFTPDILPLVRGGGGGGGYFHDAECILNQRTSRQYVIRKAYSQVKARSLKKCSQNDYRVLS